MLKKMMLLAMAVGAIVAFAAPAMAQATTTVTGTDGKAASTFTATSSNLTTQTSVGRLACNTVHITGNVSNGADATLSGIHGTATSDIHPFNTAAECPILGPLGEVVTAARITSISGEMTLEGGSGEAEFGFHFDVTIAPGVLATCDYNTSGGAALTYSGSVITITPPGAELVGTGETGCPTEGTLDGELTLDGSIDG